MTKTKIAVITFCLIIWALITVFAVTVSNRYDWPDNVHFDYGFPFVWSTQTLSTIAGPANIWTVDINALTLNLLLWLGIAVITITSLHTTSTKRQAKSNIRF